MCAFTHMCTTFAHIYTSIRTYMQHTYIHATHIYTPHTHKDTHKQYTHTIHTHIPPHMKELWTSIPNNLVMSTLLWVSLHIIKFLTTTTIRVALVSTRINKQITCTSCNFPYVYKVMTGITDKYWIRLDGTAVTVYMITINTLITDIVAIQTILTVSKYCYDIM